MIQQIVFHFFEMNSVDFKAKIVNLLFYRKKTFVKIYDMLAGKKTAYYVCIRIECILRKQRNPTNETNKSYKGSLPPGSFKEHKSVFIVIKRRIQKRIRRDLYPCRNRNP